MRQTSLRTMFLAGRMTGVIGITGTPGTGKKTVGNIVANLLSFRFLDLNAAALEGKAVVGEDDRGILVSPKKLSSLVTPLLRQRGTVVTGHLLPFVLSKKHLDLVCVLRCKPQLLEVRLQKRGYTREKVNENVAAEILGMTLFEAIKRFGLNILSEHDTSTVGEKMTALEIIEIWKGEMEIRRPRIEWLSEVAKEGLLSRYFP